MIIKKEQVTKLLKLIDQGLTNGAGNFHGTGDFCVQQAVNKAVHGYTDDGPFCVQNEVRWFGINMNDTFCGKKSERARILKRFAVAELGSRGVVNGPEFGKKVRLKAEQQGLKGMKSSNVEQYANIAVEVLTELGSPGAEYLYMCEPGAKLKTEHKVALKKEQDLQKKLRNMTEWKGFGKPQACELKGKTR